MCFFCLETRVWFHWNESISWLDCGLTIDAALDASFAFMMSEKNETWKGSHRSLLLTPPFIIFTCYICPSKWGSRHLVHVLIPGWHRAEPQLYMLFSWPSWPLQIVKDTCQKLWTTHFGQQKVLIWVFELEQIGIFPFRVSVTFTILSDCIFHLLHNSLKKTWIGMKWIWIRRAHLHR